MQTLSHAYKKIEGIDDRCKHLIPYDGKLLVGGNNGLYIVDNDEVEKILHNQYINRIIQDKSNSNLFYICTNTGLILLENIEKNCKRCYDDNRKL